MPIPSSPLPIHAEDHVLFPRTVATSIAAIVEDQTGTQTSLEIDPTLGVVIEDAAGLTTYLERDPQGDLPLEDESGASAPLLVQEI